MQAFCFITFQEENSMKKIAVLNNKGGVGKNTICVQLSPGLTRLGFRVLLVNLYGQNDSSLFLGFAEDSYKKTFYDLLDKKNPAKVELS